MEIKPFRRKLLCRLFFALKKIYKGGISSYKGRRVKNSTVLERSRHVEQNDRFPIFYIRKKLKNFSLRKSASKYCSNEICKKKLFGLKFKIIFLLFSLFNHFE